MLRGLCRDKARDGPPQSNALISQGFVDFASTALGLQAGMCRVPFLVGIMLLSSRLTGIWRGRHGVASLPPKRMISGGAARAETRDYYAIEKKG